MSSVDNDFPQLGRYQVIDRIASGGMAEVFLARAMGAMGFQRLVALKLIHANFTRDPEFVKMFIDEARIAMHLHHRNIVQVFDLDKVGGTYFLAMEFVRGVNLYDLYERIASRDRWIEVPMALYLIAEICKGLHFAHTRTSPDGKALSIIHRDISPQNILLSFEGEVKITDFGIATAAERLHQTAAGIVKGKYAYMAPERLQESPFDARVDVFSAGILLYELLVGENPFARPSPVETIEMVLAGRVARPSARGALVPNRLDEICLRALASNPDDRWPTAQAMADALTELAMELTYARKDMASGDAAIANLLADLFPQEREHPVGQGSKGLNLPGFDGGSPDDTARPGKLSPPPRQRSEESVVATGLAEDGGPPQDLDAPTVLRPTPYDPDAFDTTGGDGDPGDDMGSFADTPKDDFALSSADQTAPTQLPGSNANDPAVSAEGPVTRPENILPDHEDDPLASTLPVGEQATARMEAIDGLRGAKPYPQAGPKPTPTPYRVAPDPAEAGHRLRPGPGRGPLTPLPGGRPRSDGPAAPPDGTDFEYPPPSRPGTTWLGVGILAVTALLCAGVAVVIINGRTEVRVVEVPVTIRSNPPGATVTIEGRPLGHPTPLRASLLTGSKIEMVFSLDGHKSVARKVVVDDLANSEVIVKLPPAAPPPHLEPRAETRRVTLQTRFGRWARIYREGVKVGTTPATIVLPVGTVTLEVAPEGKRKRKITVEVPATGPSEITLDLGGG